MGGVSLMDLVDERAAIAEEAAELLVRVCEAQRKTGAAEDARRRLGRIKRRRRQEWLRCIGESFLDAILWRLATIIPGLEGHLAEVSLWSLMAFLPIVSGLAIDIAMVLDKSLVMALVIRCLNTMRYHRSCVVLPAERRMTDLS